MSFLTLNRVDKKQGLASVVDHLKSQTQGAPMVDVSLGKAVVAMEGFSETRLGDLETAKQNLQQVLQSSLTGIADVAGLSYAQEQAAVVAGLQAAAPMEFMTKPIASGASLSPMGSETTVVVAGQQGSMDRRSISMEAFDERANKNAMIYSMVYNAVAARQDEFGEAFFPTVVQTPDQVGFMVNVKLIEVIDTIRREVSGAVNNFNRKNIVKASIDHTILRNDITKIVPIHRAGVSAQYFATDVGTAQVEIGGETVTTGALAVGKKFSLLGISQTDAAVAAGLQDETDAVDSAAKLQAVYVKLADGDVVKFNTLNIPTSTFNAAVQGNARQLNLNFTTAALQLTGSTKQIDATNLTGKAAIGTHSVRLSTSVVGSINQQEGTTQINAMPVNLEKVFDDAGNVVSVAAGAGKTIADLFIGATVIGYDLLVYRTNSNRRNRGQVIDTREMNYLYAVPVLPPITALRPVGATDANDASLLSTLITTTRIRTSNEAITKLFEARDTLKEFANQANAAGDSPEVFGAASQLVSPTYLEAVIDAVASTDSLKSADRADDVSGLLVNKLRDMAFRLYQKSGYKAAADAVTGNMAGKPTVIIGTDPVIARYLTISGDTRLLGDAFNFKVVSTLDSRMAGKIVMSFGDETSYTSGVSNALHFGNMAWKPELTLMMPATRNGANAMELTVQPMFLHVVNLPVMAYIEVSGIEAVISGKVTINTSN
jgi:hypothetical protein